MLVISFYDIESSMTFSISQDEFLLKNRIAQDTWDAAKISWADLVKLADDYLSRQVELSEAASFFAQLIQKMHSVHSVRWRVKDVEHLLEKIIRKRAEATKKADDNNKYFHIDIDNYGEVVTDLVGLRALHLFKDECFEIDSSLKASFQLLEGEHPKAYVREGDAGDFKKRLEDAGLKVVPHPAGYRSIHYIVGSRPLRKLIAAEIQVRTIFEEGWSEIDHRVRYPNFSDDPQIAWFLNIFNGLAGHADEMGSFVRSLVSFQEETRQQIAESAQVCESTLKKLETTVAELAEARQSSKSNVETATKLRAEISALRSASKQASTAQERLIGGVSWQSMSPEMHAARTVDEYIRAQHSAMTVGSLSDMDSPAVSALRKAKNQHSMHEAMSLASRMAAGINADRLPNADKDD